MTTQNRKLSRLWLLGLIAALLANGISCSRKQTVTETPTNNAASAESPKQASADAQPEPVDPSLVERIKREKWKGDLDGMAQRRVIRALVTYNRSYYFYDGAEGRGISYEALKEFE